MKKVFALLLCFALCFCVTACRNETDNDNSVPTTQPVEQETSDPDKYIIQTPCYQIYQIDMQKYKYRIGYENHILVENVKYGTAPKIENKGEGIVRLFLGFGTNAYSVRYYDVFNDLTSEEFHPFSIYADYVNTTTDEYYIAYFDHREKKFYISGFFDSAGYEAEVDLDFSGSACEKMIFLNESEIYFEYYNTDRQIVRKIVNFKSE